MSQLLARVAVYLMFTLSVSQIATAKVSPEAIKTSTDNSEETPPENLRLTLIVVDSETKKKITAKVKVLDMLNKKVLFAKELGDTLKLNLAAGGDYRIVSKADSHLFNEVEFNLAKENLGPDVKITLELSPIKIGMKLQLKEVFFETNSAKMLEESLAEIQEVYELLWEHPNLVVQIAAHTDNTGTHDDNMELSGRRAQAIVEVLKDKGVPEKMLAAKGYGETKPLLPNTTEENKQKNRRVEFIVIDIL
ncbi:OmpA family protein [Imperialibacter roseus]|uniref:OmpA family protein n=1 Tax=Imperialibacter roseus TaxID=1324217 RepID=A0ABZ0IKN5_9BACT|nr:OmpA family protein [Imperialibacter roseus]WOK04880.1 OmpA family protein [Imperialibacter roseus]